MLFFSVPQGKAVVIERFGKPIRIAKGGLHMKLPFFDSFAWLEVREVEYTSDESGQSRRLLRFSRSKYVDMREVVDDYPKQAVITSDNANVLVDSLIYYQITDPLKALYEVENLTFAIEKITMTTLRNVIGKLSLDECLRARNEINAELRTVLDEITDSWGVRVTRVEIKDIEPPIDIKEAMLMQMQAEREKRAEVLRAEGEKQAQILRAEGKKESEIIAAKGRREALQLMLSASAGDGGKTYLALESLDALRSIANGQATKIFIPYDSSALLAGIGAIAESLAENKNPK